MGQYGFSIIFIVLALAVGIYFKSPSVKGRRGEKATARSLEVDSLWHHGKTLTNVYVPRTSGNTSEIDIMYITSKGLFVLENKNYAGYIFGSESNKSWTVTLYAGKTWYGGKKVEKHQFYNPIWQNRTHIKSLKEYLGQNIKSFSIITFNGRASLKDITIDSEDVYVCNNSRLSGVIRDIWNSYPDVLSDEEINQIYNKLLPLSNSSKQRQEQHVQEIQQRFSSTDKCPVCGGKLVLRTAKRGANAGSQFYGCSNYPKCKYTKNI